MFEGVLRIEGILLQHHFWCNPANATLRVKEYSWMRRSPSWRALFIPGMRFPSIIFLLAIW